MQRKKRILLSGVPLMAVLGACAGTGKPQRDSELKGMGMVIVHELAPGASPKEGVSAISDAGNVMFRRANLLPNARGTSGIGGGSNMSFPRRVHVTWRRNTTPGEYWTTGIVVGDYTVEVLNRLPEELFSQVKAGPKRAIALHFRIADNGVQFGWAIQDGSKPGGYQYIHRGGDFLPVP